MLKNLSDYKAVLTFEDRNFISVRPITTAFFKNLGDKIELMQNSPSSHKAVSYGLSFEKTIFNEKDLSKDCVNYPTKEFQSYWNCDYKFINQYLSIYDLNPMWAKDPEKNITKLTQVKYYTSIGNFNISNKYFVQVNTSIPAWIYRNLAKGVTTSDCRMSCIETVTTAK